MRTKALIQRIIQQMLRDKRTLGLLFVAPLFVLTLMHFLFNTDATKELTLGVVNINPSIIQTLEKSDLNVKEYVEADRETVLQDQLAGLLKNETGKLELILFNEDPAVSKALQMKISQALAMTTQKGRENDGMTEKPLSVETQYVYGSDQTTFFDIFSTILVGFFVFFFVFLISGIGLLRERTTGTLERLMATPVKRREIITGYLVGYGIFAVIQTLIVILYAINVLDLTLAGSIWHVILINLLLALVALSLGILLSTFAASEFQMIQFIPIVIIPQIFFAGIIPVENMAGWLQVIAKIMPLYYGADALKRVMYKGLGLSAIYKDLLILAFYATIFIILNIFALKKYRKL